MSGREYVPGPSSPGRCRSRPPVWAQIDSGQPSIIKSNYYFNRSSGVSKSYLNGLLDSAGKLIKGSGRTHALWELDLLGIPILPDAFPPERVWSSLQTLSRKRSAIQLGAMGKFLVRAGERAFRPGAVIHQHLSHLVAYPDHVERLDESLSQTLAKWLKWRAEGDSSETLDFITALLSPSITDFISTAPTGRSCTCW